MPCRYCVCHMVSRPVPPRRTRRSPSCSARVTPHGAATVVRNMAGSRPHSESDPREYIAGFAGMPCKGAVVSLENPRRSILCSAPLVADLSKAISGIMVSVSVCQWHPEPGFEGKVWVWLCSSSASRALGRPCPHPPHALFSRQATGRNFGGYAVREVYQQPCDSRTSRWLPSTFPPTTRATLTQLRFLTSVCFAC